MYQSAHGRKNLLSSLQFAAHGIAGPGRWWRRHLFRCDDICERHGNYAAASLYIDRSISPRCERAECVGGCLRFAMQRKPHNNTGLQGYCGEEIARGGGHRGPAHQAEGL